MHRSQVMLEDKHYRFLVDEAKRRRQSISAVLRDWVDHQMQSQKPPPLEQDPLWEMVGVARKGKGDLGEDHDQYLVKKKMVRMAKRGNGKRRSTKKS